MAGVFDRGDVLDHAPDIPCPGAGGNGRPMKQSIRLARTLSRVSCLIMCGQPHPVGGESLSVYGGLMQLHFGSPLPTH